MNSSELRRTRGLRARRREGAMRRVLRHWSLVGMLVLLGCAVASAQLSTAQLSGRVTDESGAVLPGATITVTQTDTGFTRTDVTDGDGAYVLSNLPPGPYRLEVMLQGFRTYVQTGIVLQVSAAPVINAALGVGALEESVTVEGAAPLVDVQSSGISDVVRNEEIMALPLNGRVERPARHALGRRGQRGDQVGHQPPCRQRVRVRARSSLQCHEPVRADR